MKAFDDFVYAYVPLQGITVRARYGTKIATGITNSNGYCAVSETFKHAVNYSFKWESAYWDIRNGALGQAFYNGPQLDGTWNLNISKSGGRSILYASVHRAAWKFFYGNCLGINRPILTSKTKIGVLNQESSWGAGCCWGTWSVMGVIPDILISYPHESLTYDVFGTTIHELAHQSHLLFMGLSTYGQLDKEIHESWAVAVAHELTDHHYNVELASYNTFHTMDYKNYQDWQPGKLSGGKSNCYTPLFVDLIDDVNQRFTHDEPLQYPNDNISGYSLSYIQDNILVSSYGLSSFRDALSLHKINGVTDNDITLLMEYYWGYDYARPD
ncbi:MAG: hypothetical protein IKR77_06215 [Bacteroidales bacterium]|nr:hypothetical protein [Bacteroidales bacterium]